MKKDDVKTSENKTSKSRRRLLTALTAGGAAAMTAPSEWTKPALKAVVLPAHAQTSPVAGAGNCNFADGPWASTGDGSFCMSVAVHADFPECGRDGRVVVTGPEGVIVTCGPRPGGVFQGAQMVSWSCSGNAAVTLSDGTPITFEVEFENGCTCTQIINSA